MQCALGDEGLAMMRGEFNSISLIYKHLPHLVPTPLGWGKFKKSLDPTMETYYLIEDFLDMDLTIPEPAKVSLAIAELHQSIPSPNGMWGFHVTTCDGKVPHTVTWTKTWREFYTNLLLGTIKNGNDKNGVWPEFERATERLVEKVIPRLLDNLTFDGEPIKPVFLHGDLWVGNIATLQENGEIILYDSGGFYGHNEFDISTWRCIYNGTMQSHIFTRNYMQYYEPAEPVEEWDDRNRLYSLKYIMNYSINHPNENAREQGYNDMLYLIEKYARLEGLGKYNPDMEG
jgi:protein-ribulosamine 3-kinase